MAQRRGGTDRRLSRPLMASAAAAMTALTLVDRAPAQVARPDAGVNSAPIFTGRSFADADLGAPAMRHDIVMTADRARVWDEGATSRVWLERDVVVEIGPYTFHARRATAWFDPVLVDGERGDQYAFYLGGVRSPTGAAAAVTRADRLLVTGLTVGGTVSLRVDAARADRPVEDAFIRDGEARLAAMLRASAQTEGDRAEPPPARPGLLTDPGGAAIVPRAFDDDRSPLPPAVRTRAILPTGGVVAFSAGATSVLPRPGGGTAVVLTGRIALQMTDAERTRSVQVDAQRAVVFLRSGAELGLTRYGADRVEGVYAEGDVHATDGDYTVRGARVYFDPSLARGVVVDAVFSAYDEARGLPLYVRADSIRQEAADQWSASDVVLTNVAFAEPHFAVGAGQVTVTRSRDGGSGRWRTFAEAEDVGFRVGETALLTLPRAEGEITDSPLRAVRFESDAGSPVVRTRWDLYKLLGLETPESNRGDLLIDGFFERGPAGGVDLGWRDHDLSGRLFGYYVFDSGTDELTSGGEIDRDEEHRGVIAAENAWRLDDAWTVFTEASYVSDAAFVDAFFEADAEERREFTNSVLLRRVEDNEFIGIEARGTVNDFIPNEYLLQSQGYTTAKLPEARYARVAETLFGSLSYTAEATAGHYQLQLSEVPVREYGFTSRRSSLAAFGLEPGDSIGAALRDAGLSEQSVLRFDTRHEVELPLEAGAARLVPFAVGRFTAYDTDFDTEDSGFDDQHRLWGAVGVRAHTSLVRIDEGVESRALDLHRMRHIIEPSVTAWVAGSDIDSSSLPVYDARVEPIVEGTLVRAGVRQTWEAKRGVPGDRYTTEWLTINTDYVWASSDTPIESPFGRFIESRPEYSNAGEYVVNEAALRLTDAVTVVSELVHDIDEERTDRVSGGVRIDHGPAFSTLAEIRSLDGYDGAFLNAAARYELTEKYAATLFGTYDLDQSELQSVGATIVRRFPQWTFALGVDYDDISGDTGVSVSLRPVGIGGEDRRRAFTYDEATDEPVRNIQPRSLTPGPIRSGPFRD